MPVSIVKPQNVLSTNRSVNKLSAPPLCCSNIKNTTCFQLFGADAQLVDLSERGMKLKFIGGVKLKDRQKFLVRIPHPESPDKHFQMEAEARWYNPKEFTLGVYLPDLSDVELQVIQHYMVVSKKMGRVTV